MEHDKLKNRPETVQSKENDPFPEYPPYPPEEDIYDKFVEEDIDPDRITEIPAAQGEIYVDQDLEGIGLDIPGSELDNDQEFIGSEDEENNYYSLGGDNHSTLEENQG